MYKKFFVFVSILTFGIGLFLSTSQIFASTPTLSISPNGDGDSVQVNVIGGISSSSVLFYYYKTGVGQQIVSLGSTNSNGTFSITVSSAQYGVVSNSVVYVTLGGVNGAQSNSVTWPTVTGVSNSNAISLSQTGLVLSVGQSTTITANNLNSGILYLSSNSNPPIANLSISGGQITVTGNSYGSATATFCLVNNTSNCASAYITVQNSGAQALSFSQNSVSLSAGQNIAIQINGGSGYYSVTNNSSQSANMVNTSINGSVINLSTNGTSGSSSITVCTTDMNSCGIINVTIGSVSNVSNITFSQSNPTLAVGQSLNISVYGPSNTILYVSSNSNPGLAQVNLSGNTLTLNGISSGSFNVIVCASSSNCGTLPVTVNYNYTNGGKLTLSQDNVNLAVGQTMNVTISGGAMPYNVLYTPNNIFQQILNNNILSLYGASIGSSTMNVCSTGGNCLTLSVNVTSTGSGISTLPSGCFSTLGYSTITGLPCNGSTYVAPIISTPVYTTPTPIATPEVNTVTKYKFTKTIKLGSSGTEVRELQNKLKELGFYSSVINGKFGSITEKAVKAFQKKHKLSQVGSVGPATRLLLNK